MTSEESGQYVHLITSIWFRGFVKPRRNDNYKKPNKQTATLYLAENEITDNVVFEQLSKLFNTDVIDGLLRRV